MCSFQLNVLGLGFFVELCKMIICIKFEKIVSLPANILVWCAHKHDTQRVVYTLVKNGQKRYLIKSEYEPNLNQKIHINRQWISLNSYRN